MTLARCLFAAESEQTRDAGLRRDLGKLGCDIVIEDGMSKSWDRHRQFRASPYAATLLCDSDLIFQSPIDMLWEPLDQEGLLVPRFFSPPYGIDGAAGRPGFASRMNHLEDIRELIGDDLHQQTAKRMLDDRIDVNAGLLGIARPTGEDFPADWAAHMEKGRDRKILLMDEMTVVALINRHRRHLADEAWNCPADEFFRRTNLSDALVIHYFGDGHVVRGSRLGRNPSTWAGRKWFDMFEQTAGRLDLARWTRYDPNFTGRLRRAVSVHFSKGRRKNPTASK